MKKIAIGMLAVASFAAGFVRAAKKLDPYGRTFGPRSCDLDFDEMEKAFNEGLENMVKEGAENGEI